MARVGIVSDIHSMSTRPRPLLLIGNKRSGTSHLTRMLNFHPEVFVSHESDIVWILYQLRQRTPFVCYPWDGPIGMNATLRACADLLAPDGLSTVDSVAEAFHRCLDRLMTHGSAVQKAFPDKGPLRWIGDKKPVQQCDPQLHAFVRGELPHARFLHIIRHPHAVVSSMSLAAQTWGPVEYWRTLSFDQLLDRWATHEEWVLAMKGDARVETLTVRFEDVCETPVHQMRRIFDFLNLDFPRRLQHAVQTHTRPQSVPTAITINASTHPGVVAIMERYGY